MAKKSKTQGEKWARFLVIKTLQYLDVQKDGYRYKTFSGEINIKTSEDGSVIPNDILFHQHVDSVLSQLPEDNTAIATFINVIRLS
ncbi:MAG: hypothetical protein Q8R36_03985 [bacterium]|nr:hypothetical protein [bacterium]